MEAPFATNFSEYVSWMATNSPHATVLDWWRRLEHTLDDYAAALPAKTPGRKRRSAIETAIGRAPNLGDDVVKLLRQMRKLRNAVAHDAGVYVSRDQAIHYAEQALALIGVLASGHPPRPRFVSK